MINIPYRFFPEGSARRTQLVTGTDGIVRLMVTDTASLGDHWVEISPECRGLDGVCLIAEVIRWVDYPDVCEANVGVEDWDSFCIVPALEWGEDRCKLALREGVCERCVPSTKEFLEEVVKRVNALL